MASVRRRRPQNSGSLSSIGSGKWLVRVSIRDPRDGSRHFRTKRVTGTKTQAEAELTKMRASAVTYRWSDLPLDATLNDLIKLYFERGSQLATGTRRSYESLWHKWLENTIGKIRATDVAAYDYVQLWERMAEAGLTPSTMNSAFALIKGSYRAAAKYDEFTYNHDRYVAPPRPRPFVREHLTDDTLQAIIRAASDDEPHWPFLIRLALATGARRGELLALRWSALDGGWLSIRNSVDFDDGAMVLSNTKNDQPRTIALDATTAEHWTAWRQRAAQLSAVGQPRRSRRPFRLATPN